MGRSIFHPDDCWNTLTGEFLIVRFRSEASTFASLLVNESFKDLFVSHPLEIDCKSVKALLDAQQPFLFLDCREKSEYDHVRIQGTTLIPMSEMASRVTELEAQKSAPIVVHCHHGGRSLRVANWLAQQGFANVKSMAGGIDVWATDIEPGMARY